MIHCSWRSRLPTRWPGTMSTASHVSFIRQVPIVKGALSVLAREAGIEPASLVLETNALAIELHSPGDAKQAIDLRLMQFWIEARPLPPSARAGKMQM